MTTTRLDKAINGLAEIIERNNKKGTFIISKDRIVIDEKKPELWGTIFVVTILLSIQIALIIYYFLVDKTSSVGLLFILIDLWFIYDLGKTLQGNTILIIDFHEKYFKATNVNAVFKTFFPCKKVSFFEISEIELQEKSISARSTWLQLIAFDKKEKKIVLTDFGSHYPESIIAEKVKFLIEVIIWTEKQNILNQK